MRRGHAPPSLVDRGLPLYTEDERQQIRSSRGVSKAFATNYVRQLNHAGIDSPESVPMSRWRVNLIGGSMRDRGS